MRHLVIGMAVLLAMPARAAGPAMQFLGTGKQIYTCAEQGAAFVWALKAPQAVLTDAAGREVGTHFAGPSWKAADGSTVVGEPLAASAAPQPGAIAWLVLHAKSHDGAGLFADVGYVVRSATEGGVAPATGCDDRHIGAEAQVDYRATYTFFPG